MSYAQPYAANNANANYGYGFGGASTGANGGYNSFSQPAGGYMPATQQNDDSRFASESIQPLTVKQLLNAPVDPTDDSKFNVNGVKLHQLTLVARIVAADVQVTTITLTIDDCTGVIQGSYMVPVEDEIASSEMALQRRAWIKTGAWLRLVAALREQGGARSLAVYRIRRVTDFNELTFHRLEVVKSFLAHTRSKPGSAVSAGVAATAAGGYQAGDNFGVAAAVDDGLAMNPLQRVVYEYVKSKKDVAQRGVTVDEVTREAAAAHGATAATVKEILDGFASDGHMYTTIDEHHYAFCRL